jgi:hypothetical protein
MLDHSGKDWPINWRNESEGKKILEAIFCHLGEKIRDIINKSYL